MSNLITIENKNTVVITEEKIKLVKEMICRGANDSELQLFITNCNRTGLDPFQKQCWAVKRWDSSLGKEVMSFQTGVDGFRVIANRSNKYAGQVGPFWCDKDGVWKDVWLLDTPPVAAKVGVLRSDFAEPLWAVAKFSSYAAKKKDGSLTSFWRNMPDLMIAKVAECLALRKAFPQDLSGIYSSEEMEQVDNDKQERTANNTSHSAPKIESPAARLQTSEKPSDRVEFVEVVAEPLFTQDEIKETNKLTDEHNKKLPNEALGVYIMKGGKYNGKTLKQIKDTELYRYIADCSAYSKEHNKPLPTDVQENIFYIKGFLGLND